MTIIKKTTNQCKETHANVTKYLGKDESDMP